MNIPLPISSISSRDGVPLQLQKCEVAKKGLEGAGGADDRPTCIACGWSLDAAYDSKFNGGG